MRTYQQLAREQRYQIYLLKKVGFSQSAIAEHLEVDPSTISRELRRNKGLKGYRPGQAHDLALARRHRNSQAPRISKETWDLIEQYLRRDLSPEQISGLLKREQKLTVSHERIYQHVYADKRAGGDLWKHLRCRKKRRKRYGSYDRRGQILNRISIDRRPKIVDSRRRIGDWEVDTIIGKNHQQAIVSLTERKSRLTLIKKVERKTAQVVSQAVIDLLVPFSTKVHTITADNGREFVHHVTIAQSLDARFYFAHPYASWERGLNENTNGLIRQYFPKKHDFSTITDEEVAMAMNRLNNRPRKCLGFKTPRQVFYKLSTVALTC